MLDPTGRSRKWWLPLLAFLVPGACYAYAALLPVYNPHFALVAVGLTLATSLGLLCAFLHASPRLPLLLQLFLGQCMMLPAPLFASRVWSHLYPSFATVMIAATWIAYSLAWIGPFLLPGAANAFYKEMWYPKTLVVRVLATLALSLGGAAGTEGYYLAHDVYETFGSRAATLLVGAIAFALALVGPLYLSVAIWRYSRNLPQVPMQD